LYAIKKKKEQSGKINTLINAKGQKVKTKS